MLHYIYNILNRKHLKKITSFSFLHFHAIFQSIIFLISSRKCPTLMEIISKQLKVIFVAVVSACWHKKVIVVINSAWANHFSMATIIDSLRMNSCFVFLEELEISYIEGNSWGKLIKKMTQNANNFKLTPIQCINDWILH